MQKRNLTIEQLVQLSGLEVKTVQAIVAGQYTPSPRQRIQLAAALDVAVDDIQWGHAVEVDHMYGHGPQFGRSP